MCEKEQQQRAAPSGDAIGLSRADRAGQPDNNCPLGDPCSVWRQPFISHPCAAQTDSWRLWAAVPPQEVLLHNWARAANKS